MTFCEICGFGRALLSLCHVRDQKSFVSTVNDSNHSIKLPALITVDLNAINGMTKIA